jgi:F-type H+-transporting ATPase subunit epsilon
VKTFSFEMITPDSRLFSGNVTSLTIPGKQGSFGIWANHAAFISTCVPGAVKIREESGRELHFKTGKGYFEIVKNRAVFLTDVAQEQANLL